MREPKIRLRKRPKRRTGVLRKLRAKTQSATIHLTHEDDWETEVPNVKLSRVFAIVLLLHVVAVGGILAFQMLNPEEGDGSQPQGQMQNVSFQGGARDGGEQLSDGNSLTKDLNAPPFNTDEVRGLRHYRVQSGDTLDAIARDFGVKVGELEKLNGLNKGNKLYTGLILYIPNRTITAAKSTDAEKLNGTGGAPAATGTPGERMSRKLADRLNGGKLAPPPAPVATAVGASSSPDVAMPLDDPNAGIGTQGTLEPAPPAVAATERKKPDPPKPASPPAAERAAPAPATSDETAKKVRGVVKFYTVQKGDTAYALGRKFGIGHDELLKINGISDARNLRIGQKIKVPVQN